MYVKFWSAPDSAVRPHWRLNSGTSQLILLSLDHCLAMGKRSLPPRKDSYHARWCNLLPSSRFLKHSQCTCSPSKIQSKCTAQEDNSLFPPDVDGKEVGTLSCSHSSQHSLPGMSLPGSALHFLSCPHPGTLHP